jgi:hypothetical protein
MGIHETTRPQVNIVFGHGQDKLPKQRRPFGQNFGPPYIIRGTEFAG